MTNKLCITIPGFMLGLATFLTMANTSVMEVYSPLYLRQLSYNASFIGMFPTLGIVTQLVGVPTVSYFADKFRARKLFLFLFIILKTICELSFVIPQHPQPICDGITLNSTAKKDLLLLTLNGTKPAITLSSLGTLSLLSYKSKRLKFFLVLWFLRGFWELSKRFIYTLIAVATITHLKQNATKFGQYRSWGNFGGCVCIFAFGVAINFFQHYVCGVLAPYYGLLFFYIAGLQFLSLGTVPWMKFEYLDHKVIDYKEVKRVLTKPHYIFIFALGCHCGVCCSFAGRWQVWYIETLGGSTIVMAVAGSTRQISLFIWFLLSNRIIDKLGELKTLALSLLVYAGSFASLGLVRKPWFVVLLGCLQPVSYSLSFSSLVVHFSKASTAVSSAFFQGVAALSFYGIGQEVGTAAIGHLFKRIGTTFALWTLSVFTAFLLVVFVIYLSSAKNLDGYTKIPDTDSGSDEKF